MASVTIFAACGSDTELGTYQPAFAPLPEEVVDVTTDIQFDYAAAQATADAAASKTPAADTPAAPAPIEIPDNAIDLTGQSEVIIDVKDNTFVQRVIVVTEGTKITWSNHGLNSHNVTPSIDGAFEPIPTGQLDTDQTASISFPSGGEFPYYCSLHGTPRHGQNGLILVVPAA